MQTLEIVKSPVKMNTKMSNGKQDVVIGKYTRIAPREKGKVDFAYSEMITSSGITPNISSLQHVVGEHLVSLKAHIVKVSSVKQVSIKNQGTLN